MQKTLTLSGGLQARRSLRRLLPGEAEQVLRDAAHLSTESTLLRAELHADPERARDVTFVGVQFPGIDTIDDLAVHSRARMSAYFMLPAVRAGLAEGRAELPSLDYQGIVRHLRDSMPVDPAIARITSPDAAGWCRPGLASDFMPLVWMRARRRVAHFNLRLPPTRGIGSVPAALTGALASHRRLRVHVCRSRPKRSPMPPWRPRKLARRSFICTRATRSPASPTGGPKPSCRSSRRSSSVATRSSTRPPAARLN